VQLFQVVIIKYKKKLNQGLVYATLCGGPHLQVRILVLAKYKRRLELSL
jgi:hypothetical protein